jgi:hypothetical protein
MKTRILVGLAAIAVAAVAAWNVYLSTQSNNEMTDLMLANVEALAQGEVNTRKYYNVVSCTCSNGKSGKTFGCTTTSSSETCTSSFSNCYKVSGALGWPPINVETCGTYTGS